MVWLVRLIFILSTILQCSPGAPYKCFIVTDGGVAHQVGRLGSEVLQMVFKFHRIAQKEVLSQLLNKIITGCNSAAVDSYFSEWGGCG